jgi:hypothetical protein
MHTQGTNPKLTILRGSDLIDVRTNNTLFSGQHTVRVLTDFLQARQILADIYASKFSRKKMAFRSG